MLGSLARALFGSRNDRVVSGLRRNVERINALEKTMAVMSDQALVDQTRTWKQQIMTGERSLDDLLPEAFAATREAARRTLGQRHYDVQLVGGMVLHQGKIAEMKTGEGKTLVATLAVYLNALSGKGVHVVTVNDYLARRDSEWMGRVYRHLGLTTGCITHELTDAQRRAAYAADVTYGTNNEFGFDYLRDNMKFHAGDMVQRPFSFAIVDEVDSILIDEARTPLIISGPANDSSRLYQAVDMVIPQLQPEDWDKDEKLRSVVLTETGMVKAEDILRRMGLLGENGLYDAGNISIVHHLTQALRAHKLYTRDDHYIVKDGKVIIIDEFTGRMMEGRRFSDGLHQALEAKEKVTIQRENQTLASVTFQNYFRLYPKLAGMTGTAITEASEFAEIYNLDVVEIPTHVPVARRDHDDEVYRTRAEKLNAIAIRIREANARLQPVLVGTTSIEKSEEISALLTREGIAHAVLNARYHEQEAEIVAEAGRPGAVTIATNMAGRGTDIQLGGNLEMRLKRELAQINDPEVIAQREAEIRAEIERDRQIVREAGGLYVIGTERHESRRIDNQLRGRSGRQGDPGASSFYLSLQDDLMRIFGSDRIDKLLTTLGLKEGEAIIHPWINKAIERAQKKVEEHNFEIRKNLLRFDNVMNDQRKEIYRQRRDIMMAQDAQEIVSEMREEAIVGAVERAIPRGSYAEQWDAEGLTNDLRRLIGEDLPVGDWVKEEGIAEEEIEARALAAAEAHRQRRIEAYGAEVMRDVEKSVLLQMLDQNWKEHLLAMDQLRAGIGLRAYAQKDPLNEYKREAFNHFEMMLQSLREGVTMILANVEIQVQQPPPELPHDLPPGASLIHDGAPTLTAHGGAAPAIALEDAPPQPRIIPSAPQPDSAEGIPYVPPEIVASWGRVQRNAPCPCGSGRKYKHCHGLLS